MALLNALVDGPAHGYEIMRRLEERSGGMWRPSPGSVYPTLQMLDEEGLLRSSEDAGKRVYELTDAGRAEADKRGQGWSPWDGDESDGRRVLHKALGAVAMAAKQVEYAGDDGAVERAAAILTDARQELYRLLAEG